MSTISSPELDMIRDHVTAVLHKAGAHGLDHTLRVTTLCQIIGDREGADMGVLLPAALFHDIARPEEERTGIRHEEEGARMAEEYLTIIRYPEELIPAISHAIRAHRYRSVTLPQTQEAKILCDADNLDAIGAIGIARACITSGERNGDITDAIDHINEKLVKLSALMYTESGRSIADKRHQILIRFVRDVTSELEGRDL